MVCGFAGYAQPDYGLALVGVYRSPIYLVLRPLSAGATFGVAILVERVGDDFTWDLVAEQMSLFIRTSNRAPQETRHCAVAAIDLSAGCGAEPSGPVGSPSSRIALNLNRKRGNAGGGIDGRNMVWQKDEDRRD